VVRCALDPSARAGMRKIRRVIMGVDPRMTEMVQYGTI
jgi:hypothetical protein